jgi:hypothetical protein
MSRRRSIGPNHPIASATTSETNSAAPGNNNSDTIKVLCRFRPPAANARDSYGGAGRGRAVDTYKIDEQSNVIEFTSDLSEGKGFTFDKVR